MSWAWKVGTFRGIALYVHATFVLVLGWSLAAPLLGGLGVDSALAGTALILLAFGCIVLHELGHALTAQRYGVQTRAITLYPIGGVAQLERIPREPLQELCIALAGPAVNVAIALLLLGGITASHLLAGGSPVRIGGGNLANQLMWINLGLAVFNLLPAFPMDGGRALRAYLASRMDYAQATEIAAHIGQGMSFLFGLGGLIINPFLILIAFFVYIGATEEASMVAEERAFHDVPVRDAMMTRFETLAPADPLSRAMEHLLAGAQNDFPVLESERLVGMLSRVALVEALRKHGASVSVGHAMSAAPSCVAPDESLEVVLQQLHQDEKQSLPVLDDGRLVGLITLENVGELLMLRQALEARGGDRPTAFRVNRPLAPRAL